MSSPRKRTFSLDIASRLTRFRATLQRTNFFAPSGGMSSVDWVFETADQNPHLECIFHTILHHRFDHSIPEAFNEAYKTWFQETDFITVRSCGHLPQCNQERLELTRFEMDDKRKYIELLKSQNRAKRELLDSVQSPSGPFVMRNKADKEIADTALNLASELEAILSTLRQIEHETLYLELDFITSYHNFEKRIQSYYTRLRKMAYWNSAQLETEMTTLHQTASTFRDYIDTLYVGLSDETSYLGILCVEMPDKECQTLREAQGPPDTDHRVGSNDAKLKLMEQLLRRMKSLNQWARRAKHAFQFISELLEVQTRNLASWNFRVDRISEELVRLCTHSEKSVTHLAPVSAVVEPDAIRPVEIYLRLLWAILNDTDLKLVPRADLLDSLRLLSSIKFYDESRPHQIEDLALRLTVALGCMYEDLSDISLNPPIMEFALYELQKGASHCQKLAGLIRSN